MIRLAGWITYSQSFAAKLFYMKKVVTSVGGIVVTPILLLTAVNAFISAYVFVYAISFCVGVVLLLLVAESYFLFVREKVSVLLWFLYLCAVEILPVATLVLLEARSI